MAQFGALAPLGLFEFGNNETDAEKIYRSLTSSVSGAFDVTEGTHVEAAAYARAIALASARATLRHGHDQKHPMRAVEMLPGLERDFQITPQQGQSEDERRRAVTARKVLSRGNRREAIESALTALLGDDFIALRAVKPAEAVQWPANPANVGAFEDPSRVQRLFKLTVPVAVTSAAVTFSYGHFGEDDGTRILRGDSLCFEPENTGLAERLVISAADTVAKTATATFTKAKDNGAAICSYAPIVTGTQRRLFVALTASAARDPVTRRLVDDLMGRMVRGVTEWFIIEETVPGFAGPFIVGTSKVGVTSITSTIFSLT